MPLLLPLGNEESGVVRSVLERHALHKGHEGAVHDQSQAAVKADVHLHRAGEVGRDTVLQGQEIVVLGLLRIVEQIHAPPFGLLVVPTLEIDPRDPHLGAGDDVGRGVGEKDANAG